MRCCGRCSGGNGCIRLFNAYALVSRGQLDAAGTVSDGLCCLDGWRVAGRVVLAIQFAGRLMMSCDVVNED